MKQASDKRLWIVAATLMVAGTIIAFGPVRLLNSTWAGGPPDPPLCNGTPYDPDTQGCCQDTNVYDLDTQGCCEANVYDLATQDCCGPNPYDVEDQACCQDEDEGPLVYDPSEQCCHCDHLFDAGLGPCDCGCGG